MKIEITELLWVDEQAACPLGELAAASRLSESEIRELVELGVLHPLGAGASPAVPGARQASDAEPLFATGCLARLRALRRLREDLELDVQGASVALVLMERIEDLERQLRTLRAQLPRLRD